MPNYFNEIAANIGFTSSLTGAQQRSVLSKLSDCASILDFPGYDPTGATASDAAFTAAFASGCSVLHIPAGTPKCANAWNLSNLATSGKPFYIIGDGMNVNLGGGTIINFQTSGGYMADCSGSEFLVFQDIVFNAAAGSPAHMGFIFARTTLAAYAQNDGMIRCAILLPSASGASTVGSIAVANDCAEEFTLDSCWLASDTPFATSLNNEFSLTAPYGTISHPHYSNTKHRIKDTTLTPSLYAGVIAYGQATSKYDNITIVPNGSSYGYAMEFRASAQAYQVCANIEITGDIESVASPIRLTGNTVNIKAKITTASVTGPHVVPVAGTSHNGFEYDANVFNTNGNILQATGASATFYGGKFVIPASCTMTDANSILVGTEVVGIGTNMNSSSAFQVNANSSIAPHWSNSRTHFAWTSTFGNVATGTAAAATFTANGVALGDTVTAYPSGNLQGMTYSAYVQAANVIEVVLNNLTGSTITPPAGTWKFAVNRPEF